MVADGGDAERGAVAACPDDVGPSEVGENALGSELHDVDVQARREAPVPIDGEALVSPRPESVAQTLRSAEKFKYLHCDGWDVRVKSEE